MDYCLYDPYIFFKASLQLRIRLYSKLLSAGKIKIDVPDCNSFKALSSFLERLSLEGYPEEFHLVVKIYHNLYKKSFDLTKKGHIRSLMNS